MLVTDPDETLEIETAAIRLLSQNEQTASQLMKKLSAKGFDQDQIIDVLKSLQAQNLQSDQRFAQQYLHFRSMKGYGPLRITQEMKDKGIDANLAQQVLSEAEPDWVELMQEALNKKFGHTSSLNYNDQAKRARFLEYRGFPSSLIHKVIFD